MGTCALFLNQLVMKVLCLGTSSLLFTVSPPSSSSLCFLISSRYCALCSYENIWFIRLRLYVSVCVGGWMFVGVCVYAYGWCDQVCSCPPLSDEGIKKQVQGHLFFSGVKRGNWFLPDSSFFLKPTENAAWADQSPWYLITPYHSTETCTYCWCWILR